MAERLGEMRKGKRQRIEKGSRERKDLTLRCSHCYFKSSGYDKFKKKIFYQLTECIIQKISHGVKQNAKICAMECNKT